MSIIFDGADKSDSLTLNFGGISQRRAEYNKKVKQFFILRSFVLATTSI